MIEILHCHLISWDEVHGLARNLAFTIHEAGFRPDLLVAIGRGGYVPGRLLADYLHMKNLTSCRVAHYGAGARKEEQARVVNPLREDLSDLTVLVADDVNDTGESLEATVEHVRDLGAAEVRTGVLHQKPETSFPVDWYGHELKSWRWVIYPWAVIEDLTEFIRRMRPIPKTIAEARRRLREGYRLQVSPATLEDIFRLMEETVPGDQSPG